MMIRMQQTEKTMNTAQFSLLYKDNTLGELLYTNDKIGPYGKWEATIQKTGVILTKDTHDTVIPLQEAFQPLDIIVDNDFVGCIYQTESKRNFFDRFTYHKMLYQNKEYCIYPIGFGRDGTRIPIYLAQEQIAQVNKAAVVYRDLHHYELHMKREDDIIPCTIGCMYLYMMGCFDPTTTVTQGKKTIINTDRNKRLLSYYHPDFMDELETL